MTRPPGKILMHANGALELDDNALLDFCDAKHGIYQALDGANAKLIMESGAGTVLLSTVMRYLCGDLLATRQNLVTARAALGDALEETAEWQAMYHALERGR